MSPVTVLVIYRPRKGKERAFLALLERHGPALRRAGLVTATRARTWRATDKRSGRTWFVELFAWKDRRASDAAHRSPAVQEVWGPMEPLLESMEIAVVEPLGGPRRGSRVRPPPARGEAGGAARGGASGGGARRRSTPLR